MINSRKIDDLKPYVAYLCDLLIKKCKEQGIDILITSTLRDDAYQATLYAQGRTKPGIVVTKLKVTGAHGAGLAFDFTPLVNGKVDWDNTDLFNKIGKIGQSIGLEWGGAWTKGWIDKPHMQYVKGLSNKQLRAGKLPKFPVIPIEKEGFDLMEYDLKPIMKGKLLNTGSLECCSKPSNNARTGVQLKPIHEPFNIYAKASNEDREWYLVNITTEQWVAAHYVQII